MHKHYKIFYYIYKNRQDTRIQVVLYSLPKSRHVIYNSCPGGILGHIHNNKKITMQFFFIVRVNHPIVADDYVISNPFEHVMVWLLKRSCVFLEIVEFNGETITTASGYKDNNMNKNNNNKHQQQEHQQKKTTTITILQIIMIT